VKGVAFPEGGVPRNAGCCGGEGEKMTLKPRREEQNRPGKGRKRSNSEKKKLFFEEKKEVRGGKSSF